MRTFVPVLLLLACAFLALSLPSSARKLVVDEEREVLFHRSAAPEGWVRLGDAFDGRHVNFYIALTQRNVDRLEEILYDVSHPRSPHYSQHWTRQQLLDLVAPSAEDHDLVVAWLESEGLRLGVDIESLGDALKVNTTVAMVEKLFKTQMHVFSHKVTGRQRVAHLGPISVPKGLRPQIDMVTALSLFPPQRPRRGGVAQPENSNGWTIPPHLRKIYNIPSGLRGTNPNNWQAAVEFEWPGCFSYTDMEQFAQMVQMPFTNVSRIIPSSEWVDTGCDGESTMDLQLMSNVGAGVNTAYFTNEHWIYEFTQTLMTMNTPPLVTSLSWGWMEAQQCDSIVNSVCSQLGVDSRQYVARTNSELAKAGIMGLSILVCTQDEGAPSDNNADCSLDGTTQPVWPIYPSSSPHVTAVGATTLVANSVVDVDVDDDAEILATNDNEERSAPNGVTPACLQITCNNGTEEVVAMSPDPDTDFTSGGGFSNYTTRPNYQNTAVLRFLNNPNTFKPPSNLFAVNGRGYPDISAVGSHVLIVMGGVPQWNGGTSASTPITAGVISLLNDRRLNQGKKPLGFLNYILYDMGASTPTAFHDVTIGNNTCTGWAESVGVNCCKYGYGAASGWDPATGWGTPDFAVMAKYIDSLP